MAFQPQCAGERSYAVCVLQYAACIQDMTAGKKMKMGRVAKMEEKKNIMTREGLRKYENELHDLKVIRRIEVAQKIKEAREQGDLSENAEYDAAKDEQRDIEARIVELEKILKNVEVVDDEDITADRVMVGSTVTILDMEFSEEETYKIVGSTEADSLRGKISNESPVGKALIGKSVGDVITVQTPAGEFGYKVLEIKAPGRE